jgi:hypothetical protein
MIEHPQDAQKMGEEARKISEKASLDAVYEQWKIYLDKVIKSGKRL